MPPRWEVDAPLRLGRVVSAGNLPETRPVHNPLHGMVGMTNAKIRAFPQSYDWAWLACDRDDHVAAFITAGAGPIPIVVLESDLPVEESEGLIRSLPATTTARALISDCDVTSFMTLAQRGVFVYDWQDVHRRARTFMYDIVAAPHDPIRIDSLPDELGKFPRLVRLDNVSFADAKAVDIHRLTQCLQDYQNK